MLAVLVAAGIWGWVKLTGSLPRVSGEYTVAGLSQAVEVARDARGVPTIRAATRRDAFRALGFVHAQERFFQMDLQRRSSAGELAELLGPALVETDTRQRRHRLRAVAALAVTAAPADEQADLAAYRDGVNAGLTALGTPPFEYLLLGQPPRPWEGVDTALVLLSMFDMLQESEGSDEARVALIHDLLPSELATFLTPLGSDWDAALDGSRFPPPPIPAATVLDLRDVPKPTSTASRSPLTGDEIDLLPGSNNWAVAASRSAHGGAMVADDMHLGLHLPTIWFRAVIEWPDPAAPSGHRRLVGVTLPGTFALVAGSTGEIAWGFTNAQIDTGDLVVLEPVDGDPDHYRTPDGSRVIERVRETIRVRGGAPVEAEILHSVWGPIVDTDTGGRRRAYRWVAHDPQAVNLALTALADAADLDQALALANRAGIPAQNFVCADASGRIGWTIAGRIPRRVGFDGRRPESWADGRCTWDGWLAPDEVPRIVDPGDGALWTANNRVVGGEALTRLGHGGYDLGARARQIRDRVRLLETASEWDLMAVQLDDRALFLERWHHLAIETLTPAATASIPRRAELRGILETSWTGRASIDSPAYRLVRELRAEVARRALEPLVAPCKQADATFSVLRLPHVEQPLWQVLQARPAHMLAAEYPDWDALVLASLDAVAARAIETSGTLAAHTWGRRNTVHIRHPLARALGPLAALVDLPPMQLPGDSHMPRVQSPTFGASERFVISPGREESALFHLPGGQSGHPLSPHYRSGYRAWAAGEPTPLLPGPATRTLTLVPSG